MIDHLSIPVSDVAASKLFYSKALAPLGYTVLAEFPSEGTGQIGGVGFGVAPKLDLLIKQGFSITPVHVAFRAANRALVREFYAAAMAAGGCDNGAPELCPEYHANYFAAFVLDADGHNVEAVCHDPE